MFSRHGICMGLCAVKTFKKTAGIPVVVELVEKPLP